MAFLGISWLMGPIRADVRANYSAMRRPDKRNHPVPARRETDFSERTLGRPAHRFPKLPAPLYSSIGFDRAAPAHGAFHGDPSDQAQRLHAAGQHPHRRLALSRRLAGHEFQLRAHQGGHPEARSGEVRRLLHGRPHGRAEHADGCAQAEPHLDLVRAVHAAVGAVAGDLAHRAGRHRLDHLRRALSHRAALRLARPHQRRPRRLEHRHHLQPGCRAELRHGRAHGARRALSARPRVLRRRHRAVGFLGRRRLHPRRRERRVLRSRQDAHAQPQGRIPLGEGPAQHRAPGAGLAGDRAGRRIRCPASQLAAETAETVFTALPNIEGRQGVLRRRQRPHGEARPQSRAHDDPAGLLRRGRRHGRGGAKPSAPSSTAW